VAKVLVAVALSEDEAKLLEEIAKNEGHNDLGKVLEKALRLFIEVGDEASTSSQPLYLSRRVGRIQGSVYH
jgi:hypothetical protein